MVSAAQPKAETKEAGATTIRPPRPFEASGSEAAEQSASQPEPGAADQPPPPRPLPRRAGNSAPLPPPAAKCPRPRRAKQEVEAGAQGEDPARPPGPPTLGSARAPASGSEAQAHGAPARRPPSEPAGGRGARAAEMGVTPSFRRCPVTARPRPRPQASTPRPRRAPLWEAGAPRLPCRDPLPSTSRRNPDSRSPGRSRASWPPPLRRRAPRSLASRDPRGGLSPRTREDAGGGDRTVGTPLPRGASGPALTSASRRGVGSTARGLLGCRTGARA